MSSSYPPSDPAQTSPNAEAERASRPPSDRPPDRTLPDWIRKAVEKGFEAGVNTLSKTDGTLRQVIQDSKIPKELVTAVTSQVDDTKNAILRVVGKEVRRFLEATDLAGELQKALSHVTLHINTEIRITPNENGEGLKSEVQTFRVSTAKRSRK